MLFIHETPFDHVQHSMARRAEVLASKIDLDDVAIDSAPFQLVRGTSLYKVALVLLLIQSSPSGPHFVLPPRAKPRLRHRERSSRRSGRPEGTARGFQPHLFPRSRGHPTKDADHFPIPPGSSRVGGKREKRQREQRGAGDDHRPARSADHDHQPFRLVSILLFL